VHGPTPKPHKPEKEPKVKTVLQLARSKLAKAANLITEAKGWDAKLQSAGCPDHLRTATTQDMAVQLKSLETARSALELAVSTQAGFAPWAEHVRSTNMIDS
jgi:hypothetical protein